VIAILDFPENVKVKNQGTVGKKNFKASSNCLKCGYESGRMQKDIIIAPENFVVTINFSKFTGKKKKVTVDHHEWLKVKDENYRLAAVVCHQEYSVNSGHFLAFVRRGNNWLRISDEKFSKTTFDAINKYI
jgi:Ubiquitin carboxyl-terminal hydrolase